MKKTHKADSSTEKAFSPKAYYEELKSTLSDFGDEISYAVLSLIMGHEIGHGAISENTVKFEIQGASYILELSFNKTYGLPIGDIYAYFGGADIKKQGEEYVLSFDYEDSKDEFVPEAQFCFSDITMNISFFRCGCYYYASPWAYIQNTAYLILSKSEVCKNCFNDEEKALLPLLKELSFFPDNMVNCQDDTAEAFTHLITRFERYGFDELVTLTNTITDKSLNDRKRNKARAKLKALIWEKKYEPLWQELYALILHSQEGYPTFFELDKNVSSRLLQARGNIQKRLELHGYAGKYPHFTKTEAGRSKDDGKRTVYHIFCNEIPLSDRDHPESKGESFIVQFICGKQTLRAEELTGNVFSCAFGESLGTLPLEPVYEGTDVKKSTLERYADIATKRAEGKRLTKEERKEIGASSLSLVRLFLMLFVFGGTFFGACMTVAFFAMLILFWLIDGAEGGFIALAKDYPWLQIFLGCGLSFGGIISIVFTVAAKKKSR